MSEGEECGFLRIDEERKSAAPPAPDGATLYGEYKTVSLGEQRHQM